MSKFDERAKARFLGCLTRGMRRGESARAAGVDRHTVARHAKEDPAFAEAMRQAEELACDVIENALWEKAKSGHYQSIRFWLLNRAPDRWQDRRPAAHIYMNPQAETPADELPKLQEELLSRLKALPTAEQTRLEPEKESA